VAALPQVDDHLDVGCGDGALTLTFWQNGASLVAGCDLDPRMIARASAEATRFDAAIGYTVARAEGLPFRDRSFDIVTLITVLAFAPEPALAVREVARVLRTDGRLVLCDLGKRSLWAASRRIRGRLGAEMWKAARFRSASELQTLLQAAQLRVERVSGASYYPRRALMARVMAPIDPVLGDHLRCGVSGGSRRQDRAHDTRPSENLI
jgi:ubiquinone/menaquinone biosynthesis C-methylase UbiE